MKHIIYLLLILCALPAYGQKSQQVQEYLGQRYESEKPTGTVTFRFEKGVLKRTGDGQKTYSDLLTHVAMYSDAANAGALLGIQVNGKNVQPVMTTRMEASGEVQPIPEKYGGPPKPGFWASVPDSNQLEQYKIEMMQSKREFGRQVAPRQAFLFWTYRNFALPILFLLAFLGWLIAKAAYNESKHDLAGFVIFGHRIADIGHLARYFVFGLAGVVFLIEIANDAIQTFFVSESLWWWMFRTIIVGLIAYLIFTRWVVPNPRIENSGSQITIQNRAGRNSPPLNHG